MVLVEIEDNLEDVVVVVINANVVVEDEDKVDMDQTDQEDQELQEYVVEVGNTWNPYHAVVGLDEEPVKNEEVMVVKKVSYHKVLFVPHLLKVRSEKKPVQDRLHHRGYTLSRLDIL